MCAVRRSRFLQQGSFYWTASSDDADAPMRFDALPHSWRDRDNDWPRLNRREQKMKQEPG
jgi:hypothetical protein